MKRFAGTFRRVQTLKLGGVVIHYDGGLFLKFLLTGLPFMNQLMSAAGFDFDEVQLTSIVSPIEYLSFPPVISGTSVGKTEKKK